MKRRYRSYRFLDAVPVYSMCLRLITTGPPSALMSHTHFEELRNPLAKVTQHVRSKPKFVHVQGEMGYWVPQLAPWDGVDPLRLSGAYNSIEEELKTGARCPDNDVPKVVGRTKDEE
ncbi:hypothetical protein STEG23_024412, partial [Scotinomys teguina]